MVKRTEAIRRQISSVFDHFVGLALKSLTSGSPLSFSL